MGECEATEKRYMKKEKGYSNFLFSTFYFYHFWSRFASYIFIACSRPLNVAVTTSARRQADVGADPRWLRRPAEDRNVPEAQGQPQRPAGRL